MLVIVAGLAAALAFVVNRWLVRSFGNRAILFWAPAIEELLKTGLAVAAAVPIWPVHFVFGLVEMAYLIICWCRVSGMGVYML